LQPPLENSAQTAPDPCASVPLAEAGEVAGKTATTEGKALKSLKEAGNDGAKAGNDGAKAGSKTKKAGTKTPSSFRSTNIPGEAVVVTIIPKQFTMTTNTS